MIDPKKQAEMDQALEALVESVPPLLRRLYLSLTREGFSESEALSLVRAYIHGMAGGKIS